MLSTVKPHSHGGPQGRTRTPGVKRHGVSRPLVAQKRPGFQVIFEDSDLVAVNKDAGILSVPFSGARSPNALERVNRYLDRKRQHALIVHRIDRYTSGVIVFAKHSRARERLVRQFMDHTPVRRYLALVRGTPRQDRGELRHYMKLSKNGFRQVIVPRSEIGAAVAEMAYKIVESRGGLTLLRIVLRTGLKNQIRVQLAAVGLPIVGDRHYAPEEGRAGEFDRQALHAEVLGVKHPATQQYIEFRAPLPDDMAALLRRSGFSDVGEPLAELPEERSGPSSLSYDAASGARPSRNREMWSDSGIGGTASVPSAGVGG
jgi:23S rRNA pseudouridine1911/1915/1917 synthase